MCKQAETQHFLHRLLHVIVLDLFVWFAFAIIGENGDGPWALGAGSEPEFESQLHHLSMCNFGKSLSLCACVP